MNARRKLYGVMSTITDEEMVNIIIEDIKEMDLDGYISLIEYLYPVVAKGEDGLVTLEPDLDCKKNDIKLHDIF